MISAPVAGGLRARRFKDGADSLGKKSIAMSFEGSQLRGLLKEVNSEALEVVNCEVFEGSR